MKKLLALNRSEIAIRIFRAANELGLRTVAIYSHEDRFALHRFKADEAYLVGEGKGPVEAYLDIDGIVALAQGEGRRRDPPRLRLPLRERRLRPRLRARPASPSSARSAELLDMLGDKVAARAHRAEGRRPDRPRHATSPSPTRTRPRKSPSEIGFPVIVKAAFGGGGRGMRVVRERGRARRARSTRPSARPAPPSATPTCSSRSSSAAPSTSKCSSSATSTATSSTSSSATARSSAGTRRSSRSRPAVEPRPEDPRRRICDAAVALGARGRLRQRRHGRVPGRRRHAASSSSSRSTRASRSSTPSPRWSPASTSSSARS